MFGLIVTVWPGELAAGRPEPAREEGARRCLQAAKVQQSGRRRLGMELRALREATGLNSQQAAEELGCSQSKISRVENGKTPVSVRDVRDLLVLYRVTDEQQRERLLSLARESRQRGWWAEFGPWLPSGFDTYAGMEAATASVRAYQAQLVHGLLQTEDYARALLSALRVEDTRNTVEKLVALPDDQAGSAHPGRDSTPPVGHPRRRSTQAPGRRSRCHTGSTTAHPGVGRRTGDYGSGNADVARSACRAGWLLLTL